MSGALVNEPDELSVADGIDEDSQDEGLGIARVHRRVRDAILSGELEPGAVMSQVRLASSLGVTRTPLRESLRLLQREGLIESEPNRRIRIAPFSLSDLDEIYASRIALEALAIRLTTIALTADDVAEMRACLEQMRRFAAQEDYERWLPPHQRFHALAVSHAGVRLERTLGILSDHAERYRRAYTTQAPHAWSVGLLDHRRILVACEERDPDAAADALAVHLGRTALTTVALASPTYDPIRIRGALHMVGPRDSEPGDGSGKRSTLRPGRSN